MGPVGTPRRKPIHLAFFSKVCKVGQIYAFLSRTLRIPREEMRLWLYVEEARMVLLEDEEMLFGRAAEQVNMMRGLQNVVYDGQSTPLNLLMEGRYFFSPGVLVYKHLRMIYCIGIYFD